MVLMGEITATPHSSSEGLEVVYVGMPFFVDGAEESVDFALVVDDASEFLDAAGQVVPGPQQLSVLETGQYFATAVVTNMEDGRLRVLKLQLLPGQERRISRLGRCRTSTVSSLATPGGALHCRTRLPRPTCFRAVEVELE